LSEALRYVEVLIHYNNRSTLIVAFDNDVLVVAEGGNGLVSLKHHKKNWAQCPKGVSKSVDYLLLNIHPPLKDNALRMDLEKLANETKQAITDIVQRHIERQENLNLASTTRCTH